MSNPWDKKDRRRKLSIRDPKQRILICTEGMTEKLYFDAFRMSSAKICPMGYNALKTVEEAVSLKNRLKKLNEGFHQYWVVFDNDDNTPDQIMKAIRLAEANKFFWAFSNPSFEIWYLFHFTRLSRSTTAQELKNKHLKQKNRIANYHETLPDVYSLLLDKQENAIRTSKAILEEYTDWQKNPVPANPSTNVHALVETLNRYL